MRASLTTLSRAPDRRRTPSAAEPRGGVKATPEALRKAARAIGDRLEALAYQRHGEAAWLGLSFAADGQCSLSVIDAVFFNGSVSLVFWLLLAFTMGATRADQRGRIPMYFYQAA